MRNDGALNEFVDGLGPGQLVGRQVLGAPSLGDIQLSLCHQKGFLEVEVIRARGLQVKYTINCGITLTLLTIFPAAKTRVQDAARSVCQGLLGVGKALCGQDEDLVRATYSGPAVPAAAGVQAVLHRMHTTGATPMTSHTLTEVIA